MARAFNLLFFSLVLIAAWLQLVFPGAAAAAERHETTFSELGIVAAICSLGLLLEVLR